MTYKLYAICHQNSGRFIRKRKPYNKYKTGPLNSARLFTRLSDARGCVTQMSLDPKYYKIVEFDMQYSTSYET